MQYLVLPDVGSGETSAQEVDWNTVPAQINRAFFIEAQSAEAAAKACGDVLPQRGGRAFVVVPYKPEMFLHFQKPSMTTKVVNSDGETVPKVVF